MKFETRKSYHQKTSTKKTQTQNKANGQHNRRHTCWGNNAKEGKPKPKPWLLDPYLPGISHLKLVDCHHAPPIHSPHHQCSPDHAHSRHAYDKTGNHSRSLPGQAKAITQQNCFGWCWCWIHSQIYCITTQVSLRVCWPNLAMTG